MFLLWLPPPIAGVKFSPALVRPFDLSFVTAITQNDIDAFGSIFQDMSKLANLELMRFKEV